MSKWTEEEHQELVKLREIGHTYKEIAERLENKFDRAFTFDSVRNRIRRTEEETNEDTRYKETVEILKDGSHKSDKLIRMSAEQSKDVNFLLEAHGYDIHAWELVNARSNMWNVYSKKDKVQVLYSSKITVKPKIKEYTINDVKAEVREIMKDYKPVIFEPLRYAVNGRLLELNISDLHINKLGYKDGEYDHKQAEEVFFYVINDVLSRTQGQKFEKILFIWSHDFFNIDNLTKTTTRGTPQDTSMRFHDMYKLGKRMLIQGIDLIKQVAPVETVQVGANHDMLTSYTLSEVLESFYHNDPSVTVDTNPLPRKYRSFGKCLLGFSHGNEEKKRLGKLPPVEAKKEWGDAEYVEMHAAHLHSEQAVVEDNGVIVRYLSSPSGTDNWHFGSGYVGAIKKCQAFIWDKELGVLDVIHTPITHDLFEKRVTV